MEIRFEDSLFEAFTVYISVPGFPSFNTGDSISAEVDITPERILMRNILFDPSAEEPLMSPLNLRFEITGNPVIEFSPEKLFSQSAEHYNFCKYFFGAFKDFIKAKQGGTSKITVSGDVVPAESDWLDPPNQVEIIIEVPEGARPILDEYYETANDVDDPNHIENPIGNDIEVWKYPEVILKGHVENYSTDTKLRLYVQGVQQPEGCFTVLDPEDGIFLVNVSHLSEGNNDFRVEAENVFNFGSPGIATVEVFVPRPEFFTIPDDLEKTFEGMKLALFKISCKHSTVIEIAQPHIGGESAFYLYNRQKDEDWMVDTGVGLKEGVNKIIIKASNAFTSVSKSYTISTKKPEVWFTEVKGLPNDAGEEEVYPINNGVVNIYESPVKIKGSSKYCNVTLTRDKLGGLTDNQIYNLPKGDFSQQMNIDLNSNHKLILKGQNDFGTTTTELYLNRKPITWTYTFQFTYFSRSLGIQVIFTIYNPNNSTSQTIGPLNGLNFTITENGTEGVKEYEGNLFEVQHVGPPGIYVDLTSALAEFDVRGIFAIEFNNKVYKYDLVGIIKPEFVINILEAAQIPPWGWANDGYVRFRTAMIHPWLVLGNAGVDIGRKLS